MKKQVASPIMPASSKEKGFLDSLPKHTKSPDGFHAEGLFMNRIVNGKANGVTMNDTGKPISGEGAFRSDVGRPVNSDNAFRSDTGKSISADNAFRDTGTPISEEGAFRNAGGDVAPPQFSVSQADLNAQEKGSFKTEAAADSTSRFTQMENKIESFKWTPYVGAGIAGVGAFFLVKKFNGCMKCSIGGGVIAAAAAYFLLKK